MQTSERIRFPGALGGQLAARLDRPPHKPMAYVLFAHCFSCSKDLRAAGWISRALVARGLAVLRFDFTGLGESEGDFADTNFSSNLDDLVAAANYLRCNHEAPRILVGHSLGGAAVLAAADRIPESVAVATIAAPSDTTHLADTILRMAPDLSEQGEAEVRLAGRPFRIKMQLVDDLQDQRLTVAIQNLRRALLVLHSPVDEIVGVDHARRIFEAARHPKSFVSLDGADHLLLQRERDAHYVAEVLAAWAGRYLEGGEGEAASAEETSDEGTVIVHGAAEGLAQHVQAGRHSFAADEPERVGGTNTGPTPYDLLLASLGACISMTLRLYAERKKWPLKDVEVRLSHDRIHAQDCADCETKEGRVDEIRLEVVLQGPLQDEQCARLMEIARRCPVHRTLTGEIKIRTTLECAREPRNGI